MFKKIFRILKILINIAILVLFFAIIKIYNIGEVSIKWLDYQIETDAITAIIMSFLIVISTLIILYILIKITSLDFKNLFKIFFKKHYVKRLETIINRHNKAFLDLSQTLKYLDENDLKMAKKSYLKFASSVKNKEINDYLKLRIQGFIEKNEVQKTKFNLLKFFKK